MLLVSLGRACHPGPTVVVTAAVTGYAVAAGRDATGCLLVLVTVLVGQLSIGWSNDGLDARRDAAVGRADKPAANGEVSARTLVTLAVVALTVSTVLSFVVAGARGGLCHVVLLASAWAYNLGLKSTRASLVPYAVGFGALPGFVTYGLDPAQPPAGWTVLAAGLLGVAAGLANAAPDIEDDRRTGVRGAVGRLGADAARVACVGVLVVATVVVLVGGSIGGDATGARAAWTVGVTAAVTILGVLALRAREARLLFPAVLAIALLDVALLVAAIP